MPVVLRQILFALRRLRRSPAFTAVAVTSLAFGIGVNTLMFSFMNAVLFKGLPFPDADQLVEVSMAPPDSPGSRGALPPPLYFLLRDRMKSFEAMGVYDFGRQANLAGDAAGAAERLDGHRISSTALKAFGVQPLLGRLPTADEDLSTGTPTILLSHDLWQRRFGGKREVVGQMAQVDGNATVILGVMPEQFEVFDTRSAAWVSFGFDPQSATSGTHWLHGIARLKPGVSVAQAAAETRGVMAEYAQAFPTRDKDWTITLTPFHEAMFGSIREPLITLQIAVAFVLLVSCANLAALLLARAASREREMSVRLALGQSRWGVIGQLLTESLLLAVGGGVVGGFLTWLALPALRALTPEWFPRLNDVTFDLGVFAFSAAMCLVTGVVFGIVPAWQASRPNIVKGLHEASTRVAGSRLRAFQLQALVAVQVALAFVLLVGAGLMIRSFAGLAGQDVGIDPSGLLSFEVQLPRAQYIKSVGQVGGVNISEYNPAGPMLFDRINDALQTMPGVVRAAGVGIPPFAGNLGVQFSIEGQPFAPKQNTFIGFSPITEKYFQAMGIRLVRGRDFSAIDEANAAWVAVVNESMAKEYFPAQDPIGKRVTFTFYPNDGERPREIVGLVADVKTFRGQDRADPLVFIPHRQVQVRQRASLEGRRMAMSYVVRTAGDPLAQGGNVQALVAKIDPTTPVTSVRTVESYLDQQVQQPRFTAILFGIFATVALVIGAVGIYGVTSHGVTQRHQEFGIRRALGATTGTVLGLVLRRALLVVAIGAAVGLGASLLLTRFIASYLWGVTPSDPTTFVVIAAVLIGTAAVACLVPGLRATRVDPLVALRHE